MHQPIDPSLRPKESAKQSTIPVYEESETSIISEGDLIVLGLDQLSNSEGYAFMQAARELAERCGLSTYEAFQDTDQIDKAA